MKEGTNGKLPSASAFAKRVVLNREKAERIMEELGFEETERSGVYQREVVRQHVTPCFRRFQLVDLDRLLMKPSSWRHFLRRNRMRAAREGLRGGHPTPPAAT